MDSQFISDEEAARYRQRQQSQDGNWWQTHTHQPAGPAWGDAEQEEHARQVKAFFASPKMEPGPEHQEYLRDLAGDALVVGRTFWEWIEAHPASNERRPRW
jgi:hypothetical protein